VYVGRSGVHSVGLFAGEIIEEGAMVCEYIGERVRCVFLSPVFDCLV
jgi:SET domain-containing protein